jgi:hypothetical protein
MELHHRRFGPDDHEVGEVERVVGQAEAIQLVVERQDHAARPQPRELLGVPRLGFVNHRAAALILGLVDDDGGGRLAGGLLGVLRVNCGQHACWQLAPSKTH